ncbi:MAG: tRNA (N(6)-L-threonylcarbamoyladenosine(37)-C(2))-methylthiotransferase MtaB [Desulfobacula sp.]|nr:tRNA (N(6)-L-threonylcarbamoyladenosine(37)-C(2))-methylthiotransferase MtaB [Desulfobacula sp.]
MKTFFIQTLGCKVNQYESDGIASGLEERGWTKGEKNADVVIVNTCAVTSRAAMQSRQAIRKIIRENPEAKVIVTGCHAQTDPEAIKKIDHIDHLVCHQDKLKIADHLTSTGVDPFSLRFRKIDRTESDPFKGFNHAVKGDMTRAYLKIQDGCNAFCTYCIVPHARGASVSMPENEVLRHLRELGASGVNEVIVTGIHAGMYGLDFKEKSSLLELLTRIDRDRPVYRLRLSSIEPCEINEGIIRLAGPGHILCDHFHIPLQSGDDGILRKMKRPYDRFFFKDMVQMIHEILPFAGIGVDTLIGFPTETDRQFENTYELIESLPISYLHVFPFSARKGTPAYHFDPKVDEKTIKDRCAGMRTLDKIKRREFVGRNLNQKQEGLVQNKPDKKTGMLKAITSNYLTVLLKGGPELCGKILDLVPEQWDKDLIIKGRISE